MANASFLKKELNARSVEFLSQTVSLAIARDNLSRKKSIASQEALRASATFQDLTSSALAKPPKWSSRIMEILPHLLLFSMHLFVREKLELESAP
jgi:hypothetical protein